MTFNEIEICRNVRVIPERLSGWITRFATRHGSFSVSTDYHTLGLAASDGAHAFLHTIWDGWTPGDDPVASFIAHQQLARTVAVLLARKGRHAVAVANGPDLIAHRSTTNYVQSRTKKGGQSQQRYARRRDNQATKAYQRAAQDLFEIASPYQDSIQALAVGGDSQAVKRITADPKLAKLTAKQLIRVPGDLIPNFEALGLAVDRIREVSIDLDEQATA